MASVIPWPGLQERTEAPLRGALALALGILAGQGGLCSDHRQRVSVKLSSESSCRAPRTPGGAALGWVPSYSAAGSQPSRQLGRPPGLH